MFNRIKSSIKHFKDIRKGTSIPIFYCTIDITKPNEDKNCMTYFHPNIPLELTKEQLSEVYENMGRAIDIIRDNIDKNNLK